jgi:hypothetical protein
MVWDGLGWFGMVWDGLGWFGMVWDGVGWICLAWFGPVWVALTGMSRHIARLRAVIPPAMCLHILVRILYGEQLLGVCIPGIPTAPLVFYD